MTEDLNATYLPKSLKERGYWLTRAPVNLKVVNLIYDAHVVWSHEFSDIRLRSDEKDFLFDEMVSFQPKAQIKS